MSIPRALNDELKSRYGEPHRHYHTWDHVAALCRHVRDVHPGWTRLEPVRWALFWHDAIYDPRRSDNEELSAQLLEKQGRGHISDKDLGFAAEIIRATAKHQVPDGLSAADEHDLALFLDIDLAILGAPEAVFDRYEADVRAEYAFVPEEVFRAGRARVLKSFSERPSIYFTPEGKARWEAQARANVARSLKALGA